MAGDIKGSLWRTGEKQCHTRLMRECRVEYDPFCFTSPCRAAHLQLVSFPLLIQWKIDRMICIDKHIPAVSLGRASDRPVDRLTTSSAPSQGDCTSSILHR
jgi:hypothetical protein